MDGFFKIKWIFVQSVELQRSKLQSFYNTFTIAKHCLMKLRGEGSKEAGQWQQQASDEGSQSGALPPRSYQPSCGF